MKQLLLVITLIFSIGSKAQLPDTLVPTRPENYISLRYDNDFFSATDRYYTQGIIFSFIHPIVHYSPFSYTLIKLKSANLNYYGWHLEQDVFTPVSIRHEGVFYGERPYTAVFFLSHSLVSMNSSKKFLLRTQLDLGVLGPAAKGEEEQKGIHKALVNIQPLGWEYQLSNAPVVNYNLRFEKGLYMRRHAELIGAAMLRAGTLYTDAGLGLVARLGIMAPYFNNLGLENNAASRSHKFKLYGIAKAGLRGIGYNATLQGGPFATNIYTLQNSDIERLVFDCQGGIVIAWKRFSLEYTKAYITPEFKRGVDHGWGQCVITVCF